MSLNRLIVTFIMMVTLFDSNAQEVQDTIEAYSIRTILLDTANHDSHISTLQDSIKLYKLQEDTLNMCLSMQRLASIYGNSSITEEALSLYNTSLDLSESIGYHEGVFISLRNIGQIEYSQDNYLKAINTNQRGLKKAQELKDSLQVSEFLSQVARLYAAEGKWEISMNYITQSEKLLRALNEKEKLQYCLTSKGYNYNNQGKYKQALASLDEAYSIIEMTEQELDPSFLYVCYGNAHRGIGNNLKALEYFEKGLALKWKKGNKWQISNVSFALGEFHVSLGNFDIATGYCESALAMANEGNYLVLKGRACRCLYWVKKRVGKMSEALHYYEQMNLFEASMRRDETLLGLQEMEFKIKTEADSILQEEQKLKIEIIHQLELSEKENSRNIFIGTGLLFLLLSVSLYRRNCYVQQAKNRIEKEKDRSENLLLNILPAEIAEELKEKGRADARDFDLVSILFTDFKGFTAVSEKLSAQELVAEIHTCFEAFDGIMDKYNIEKIKTIGDAYMAAGGLPVPSTESAKNTVLAALEMQGFIEDRCKTQGAKGEPAFAMRIGIHTGPVVAGIVGVKKFQYDIWGDAVNTASRMESNGEVGKVNISQAMYELLKEDPDFIFESRGKIEAKGKGEIEMYFVSLKTEKA